MQRLRWVVFLVLLGLTAWLANLAAYNYWAAGGPPVANPELYARRASVFLVLTVVSLGSALAIVVFNVRRSD